MSNQIGMSRIEAILGNILGEENEILPPFSRNEVLLLEISEKLDGVPAEVITSTEVDMIISGIE